jgi:RES domain-containing protein
MATRRIGDKWIHNQETAALAVPSVLSPMETHYLLNPQHPDFHHIIIGQVESFNFSKRLVK